MSILFALAAAVGFGSSDFAAGHASRRSSAVSVVILTHFASFVALLAVSVFPGQGGSPTVSDIGWGLAAGLGGGFGAMFLFRGLGKGSMAVVAPITAAGAATIPVIAGLLQGESISIFGVFGVGLALVAIVMISLCADEADEVPAVENADATSLEFLASATISTPWPAPVGSPIGASAATSSIAPAASAREADARFAPDFAPPIVGPASVLAASTPFASPAPIAPALAAPVSQPLPAPVLIAGPDTPLGAPALPAPAFAGSAAPASVLAAPVNSASDLRAPTAARTTPMPMAPPTVVPSSPCGSTMPPPLMHRSIVESEPVAGVALLDLPSAPNDISSLLPRPDALPTAPASSGALRAALAPPPPFAEHRPLAPPAVGLNRTAAPTLAPPVLMPSVPMPPTPVPPNPTPASPNPVPPTLMPPAPVPSTVLPSTLMPPAPMPSAPMAVTSATAAPAVVAPPAPVIAPTAPQSVAPSAPAPQAALASAPTQLTTPIETSPSALSTLRSILRRPGIIDALLSGVGFGLFFVFIARTSSTAGQWPLASARGISAAMFFVGALMARGAVLPEKGSRRAVVLAGVLDAIAAVFFVLSTRAGLLSVGAVLASLYPAATIVLARFISHERIGRRQVLGLMLAGIAVSLLAI